MQHPLLYIHTIIISRVFSRPTVAPGKYLQNACNYLFALCALAAPTSALNSQTNK